MPGDWKACHEGECSCPNHVIPRFPDLKDYLANDASFCRLTQTNDAPLSAEESVLRTSVADLNKRLVAQRSFLEELRRCDAMCRDTLAEVAKRKTAIKKSIPQTICAIQKRVQVLGPVRRIPAEILTIIFEFAITFPVPHCRNFRNGPKTDRWWRFEEEENTLWTIELVCKTWRQNILNNPSLWSSINICLSSRNFSLHRLGYASRVKRHLRRAKSRAPLSICIFIAPSFKKKKLPSHLPNLLLPFARRIRELFLFMNTSLISGFAPLKNLLSSLTYLHILVTPFKKAELCADQDDDGDGISVFANCRHLQTLETVDMAFPNWQFQFPWERIVHYSTAFARDLPHRVDVSPNIPPRIIQQIFDCATNLETFYAEIEFLDGNDPQPTGVTCRKLTSLHIVWYGGKRKPLEELFDELYLPVLMTLKVETRLLTGADIEDCLPLVVDVLERSDCPLKDLEFPLGDDVDEGTIMECFDVVASTLERLCFDKVGSVDYPTITGEGILQLSVLRRLHTVILRGHLSFDEDIFLDMVRAWARLGRPLRHVELAWAPSNTVPSGEVREVLDMITQGVENYRSDGVVSDEFKLETSLLDVGVDGQA